MFWLRIIRNANGRPPPGGRLVCARGLERGCKVQGDKSDTDGRPVAWERVENEPMFMMQVICREYMRQMQRRFKRQEKVISHKGRAREHKREGPGPAQAEKNHDQEIGNP